MNMSLAAWLAVTTIGVGVAGTAHAQTPPADCSQGAIPDAPLVLRIAGVPDRPLTIAKVVAISSTTVDDTKYNQQELQLHDRAPDGVFDRIVKVGVSFFVASGEPLSGQTFRRPPVKQGSPEYDAQDKVGDVPVFQSWDVEVPAPTGSAETDAVDVNHVAYIASVRVEFGKQTGTSLPGRIHLCVPAGQTGLFGDKPPNSQIEVIGSFVAAVE